MIWNCVVEEPHIIHTRGLYDEEAKQWVTEIPVEPADVMPKLRAFPKFPPVHNVCHEARQAFLESPGLVSDDDTTTTAAAAPGEGFGVAWHPERDFLMCHGISKCLGGRNWRPWWNVISVCQSLWDSSGNVVDALHKIGDIQSRDDLHEGLWGLSCRLRVRSARQDEWLHEWLRDQRLKN
ncbi:hypothetical protein PG997_000683 [Apiospora hydei]|uniref:Uncharacterized protein n=1 Tax=Apiospora hydei TaxID=1337664 RepID=A0ABR1XBF7_9PEZI